MRVHISIPVNDLGKSEAFYSHLFGQPASKEKPDYINFRLDQPAIHLALVKSESVSKQRGTEHFGIELPTEETFRSWENRLTASGPEMAQPEPGAQCCYAKADKVWLSDPDGNRWEIWHRTGDHFSM
ncbi:MAG TPA: VOC family protein [Xanthomonadales bacterium]|nr:VOC family protein [Xanthomonadales bacterium]